jgi:hypothetical protein
LSDWIPFFQTVLWIALIGYVLWRYHAHLDSIFAALNKRISSGSGVKLGVLGMTVDVEAQSSQQQIEKITEEVKQVDKEVEPIVGQQNVDIVTSERELISEAFAAEDLVMRELQDEFSIPINRQVSIGPGRFDGLFIKGKIPHIVEVKLANRMFESNRLRTFVKSMTNGLLAQEYGENAKIIFVVVYRNASADISEKSRLTAIVTTEPKHRDSFEIRCYYLKQLETKWRYGGILPL